MKLLLALSLLLLAFDTVIADNSIQIQNSKKFLKHIQNNEYDSCWNLFDVANIPDVSNSQFIEVIKQLRNELIVFNDFELTFEGKKFIDNKTLNLYSFKCLSTDKNVIDDLTIDILSFENSNLIAGVQPKKKLNLNSAKTSKSNETEIMKTFSTNIDGKQYIVNGINIVHFENNQGMLAIQVIYELPSDIINRQEWANKEGVKFAKFLKSSEYYKLAVEKSKEIGKKLIDEIGVSFFSPSKGQGINAMIKSTDYNK